MGTKIILTAFVLLCLMGCQSEEKHIPQEIPSPIKALENLTVYSADNQFPDTVELIRETIFESNDEIFMPGYIFGLIVDSQDRVYINSSTMGNVGIYIFTPEGKFITKIGRYGRGPGELESIGSMTISPNNELYVLGPRLQKYSVFSTEDFSHIRDEKFDREQIKHSLAGKLKAKSLFVTENDVIVELSRLALTKESNEPTVLFNRVTKEGVIEEESILKLDRFPLFFPKVNRGMDLPITPSFARSSMVSITDDGRFYTAWSEDFLIKVFDKNGTYERAIYYPIKKSLLDLEELNLDDYRKRILKNYDLPETWPALQTFELDDVGRLWVATITDSDSTFDWWVLNEKGEMQAKFKFPGEKKSRHIWSKPNIKIHNGYFYKHERDSGAGNGRVVKYRINFKEK